MFSNSIQMPTTKTMISATASAAASAVLLRSIAKEYIPRELRDYIYIKIKTFFSSFTFQLTLIIEEFEGLHENQIFKAADAYLGTIISSDTHRFRVNLAPKETKISVKVERNQEITDTFNGVTFNWKMVSKKISSKTIPGPDRYHSSFKSEHKYFELSFHKKHKESALNNYLPYLLNKYEEVKEEAKTLKLYTLKYDRMMHHGGGGHRKPWESVKLDHPATFDTLAMESEMKRMIVDDLERFVKRKEFYRRVGKAWKRGYLLFGPPGTGKSSLIAAMANYLNFDIYDLELSDLRTNSQLRKLLISTGNRSILVVEDIDCSIELPDRLPAARAKMMGPHGLLEQGYQVTLSGLLNFIDGLWSSCGDERIIVFTTNHKDRLDPALLRPGRMDVHIHMSYCTPCGFKMLASNYHGITEHPLFSEVEQLIEMAKVSPAEVGEQLLKEEEPDIALRGLIEFLQRKKESDEIKARETASVPSEAEAEAMEELKGKKVESKKLEMGEVKGEKVESKKLEGDKSQKTLVIK